MTDSPFFSVIVPTRNRPALVADCVRTVLAQQRGDLELLLCDQSDGTASRDAALEAAAGDPRLRHIAAPAPGRSRALNAGIPQARGEWLAITDDDCRPEPDWLARLGEEIACARPREALIGRVRPGPVGPGMAAPPAILDQPEPAEFSGRVARDLIYPNFGLPRAACGEIGPFDERMGVGTPLPGGEDNDFGYRLLCAGWRILYRPAPTVMHLAWRPPADRSALKRAYGLGQGAFYAKHLARGDAFIAYRFVRDILGTARAAGGAVVRGRRDLRRDSLAFLSGMLLGAARMSALMWRGVPPEGPA